MNTTTTTSNSRKLLIPLATMAVAAAVTIGSGATWTASEPTTTAIASGILDMTANGATLTLPNLKPGDVRTGTLTISNTGTVDANLAIQESGVTNTFFSDDNATPMTLTDDISDLQLKIERDSTLIYDDNFGDFTNDLTDVTNGDPLLAADSESTDDETTFTFTVRLIATADQTSQDETAAATYTFTTTPTSGTTSSVPWS